MGVLHQLATQLRHPIIGLMALVCLIVMCIDWATYTRMGSIDILITCIFLTLTLSVPFKPIPFSYALAILSALYFLIPHALQGPNILECAWLALAVLGCSLQHWQSMPIIVSVSTCALLGDHFYTGFSGNTILVCASLLVSGISGCFLRYHHSYQQLLEQTQHAEQLRTRQEEQLRLARTLHDDVAGSMSYTIALCRDAERTSDSRQLRIRLSEIARVTSASLTQLRTNVIVPLTESNDTSLIQATQMSTNHKHGYTELCQLILMLNHRLSAAGFDGMIRCTSNLSDEIADYVSRVLNELCNNILKHGKHTYLITVAQHADSVMIIASNTIAKTGDTPTDGTKHGLRFLKSEVESRGGILCTQADDGEWQTRIVFPI